MPYGRRKRIIISDSESDHQQNTNDNDNSNDDMFTTPPKTKRNASRGNNEILTNSDSKKTKKTNAVAKLKPSLSDLDTHNLGDSNFEKRSSKRKVIVISDDDDEDEIENVQTPKRPSHQTPGKQKRTTKIRPEAQDSSLFELPVFKDCLAAQRKRNQVDDSLDFEEQEFLAESQASFRNLTSSKKRSKPRSLTKTTSWTTPSFDRKPSGDAKFLRPHVAVDESTDDRMWFEKHAPRSSTECVVHSKKYKDIAQWIDRSLKALEPQILVLTGPAGSGKTTVVRLIAAEKNLEVHEWTNPINENVLSTRMMAEEGGHSGEIAISYVPVMSKFLEFMSRLRRYTPLPTTSDDSQPQSHQNSLVIIEDAPNLTQSTQATFHNALRQYMRGRGHTPPIVFIVSTLQEGQSDLADLIPKDILNSTSCHQIKFNEIAPTFLTKALKRVISSQLSAPFRRAPTLDEINTIVDSAGGDIRTALNSLQMIMLQPSRPRQPARRDGTAIPISLMGKFADLLDHNALVDDDSTLTFAQSLGRDTSTQLLHAIGKVLWNKRIAPTEGNPLPAPLPPHLQHMARAPLKTNPETLRDLTGMSGGRFNTWLHQSYLPMFTDIEETLAAADHLSLADCLDGDWAARSTMDDYVASVATRGIMFHHQHVPSIHSLLGFKRPQLLSVSNQLAENTSHLQAFASEAFLGGEHGISPCSSLQEVVVDYLPFRCLIKPYRRSSSSASSVSIGAMEFVQQIARFPLSRSSHRPPSLMRPSAAVVDADISTDIDDHDALNEQQQQQPLQDSNIVRLSMAVVDEDEDDIEEAEDF